MKVEIRSKVVILLCIVLAVFSSCITDDDDDRGDFALVAGDALPQFSVEMSDGGVLNTQSFSGKVGVIVFFHTDCPDCQKELPVIQKVYDTYKENPDVLLSCISRSESGSEVQAYWEKHSFTLPFSAQNDDAVFSLFASHTIPRILITDKEGIIRAVFLRRLPSKDSSVLRQAKESKRKKKTLLRKWQSRWETNPRVIELPLSV